MSNPTGKNQYSGGGKGGKKISVMDSRSGMRSQITRDLAATHILINRAKLKTKQPKRVQNELRAQISNIRYAAKRK